MKLKVKRLLKWIFGPIRLWLFMRKLDKMSVEIGRERFERENLTWKSDEAMRIVDATVRCRLIKNGHSPWITRDTIE